jgi:hypothetical protein
MSGSKNVSIVGLDAHWEWAFGNDTSNSVEHLGSYRALTHTQELKLEARSARRTQP